MVRTGLVAGLCAGLLAGCVTNNAPPPDDPTNAPGMFELQKRIDSRGSYSDVTAIDEPFHLRMAGRATSLCQETNYQYFNQQARLDKTGLGQIFQVLDDKTFQFHMRATDGMNASGTMPVNPDGSLGPGSIDLSGGPMNLVPAHLVATLERAIANARTEHFYAGRKVKTGDPLFETDKFGDFLTALFRSIGAEIRLVSMENKFLVRGMTILDGRTTLISDGEVVAEMEFLGMRRSITFKGYYAVDAETGLVKEGVAKTVAVQRGRVDNEQFIYQSCTVTDGKV